MSIAKQEQYEHEQAVFQYRVEAGLQAMRAWLFARREGINKLWPTLEGESLTRLQGEARLINRQIEMIDAGPRIKGETA